MAQQGFLLVADITGYTMFLTRSELEHVVSLYHLGRQEVRGAALCCDVETREHCACDGWNRFDNAALESFCLELTGRRVEIG